MAAIPSYNLTLESQIPLIAAGATGLAIGFLFIVTKRMTWWTAMLIVGIIVAGFSGIHALLDMLDIFHEKTQTVRLISAIMLSVSFMLQFAFLLILVTLVFPPISRGLTIFIASTNILIIIYIPIWRIGVQIYGLNNILLIMSMIEQGLEVVFFFMSFIIFNVWRFSGRRVASWFFSFAMLIGFFSALTNIITLWKLSVAVQNILYLAISIVLLVDHAAEVMINQVCVCFERLPGRRVAQPVTFLDASGNLSPAWSPNQQSLVEMGSPTKTVNEMYSPINVIVTEKSPTTFSDNKTNISDNSDREKLLIYTSNFSAHPLFQANTHLHRSKTVPHGPRQNTIKRKVLSHARTASARECDNHQDSFTYTTHDDFSRDQQLLPVITNYTYTPSSHPKPPKIVVDIPNLPPIAASHYDEVSPTVLAAYTVKPAPANLVRNRSTRAQKTNTITSMYSLLMNRFSKSQLSITSANEDAQTVMIGPPDSPTI